MKKMSGGTKPGETNMADIELHNEQTLRDAKQQGRQGNVTYDAAGKAGHVSVYATQMVWVFSGAGDTAEVLCHDGARGLVPRSVLPADPEVAPGPPKVTKAASLSNPSLL